jgi:asparagine synthase (glutamine-hydrolysing)
MEFPITHLNKLKMDFTGKFNTGNENSLLATMTFDQDHISYQLGNEELFYVGSFYNKKELFHDNETASNAEVAFSVYKKKGVEGLKLIEGEFLVIISKPGLFLVFRDRHGAGPQFFFSDTFFGSELSLFLNEKNFVAEPEPTAIYAFLNRGYIPAPLTSLKGVRKLPAGSILQISTSERKILNLYDFEAYKSKAGTLNLTVADATGQFEHLHKQAIKQRIEGASSVGLLLSGGYDSGGNISALSDLYSGPAFTYSIGFKDDPWTELPLAKILSERYQTRHMEYEIDGSELSFLPEIIRKTGDPFQESGLMVNHSVMRMVARSGTNPSIILGGDGNDQHFGTFGKELAINWNLRKYGLRPFQKLYETAGQMPVFDRDNILFRTQFHNRKILNILEPDTFGFLPHQLNKLLNPGFRAQFQKQHVPSKYKSFDEFYVAHNYFVDLQQTVNEIILYKASRMASLYGNKLSFPYMSTDLYNWLEQLPRELKCKGSVMDLAKGHGTAKFLHKNYLKEKLPKAITQRKKQGGFAPLSLFFKDELQRKKIFRFIGQSDAVKTLFIPGSISAILNQYQSQANTPPYWFWYRQINSFQIFNILVLCVWWEIFINRKEISTLEELFD